MSNSNNPIDAVPAEVPAGSAEAEREGIDPEVYQRRWMVLAVLCLSLVIVVIGNTSLNVAIPTLAQKLSASTSQLQWMVDAYALVFAGLLFTAGTIGDRFGRKGALQAGLGLFLVGAAVAASATGAATVIAARAVMGIAAAFVMPSTLSILTNVFPSSERPKAIATWAGLAGGGAAIGPIASGFILEHFSWNWVFLVNVPIILLAIVTGAVIVPKSKDPEIEPIDIPGAVLSIVTLSTLVYGIIEAPAKGWLSASTGLTLLVSLVAGLAFVYRESTTPHPMIDLKLFKNRHFSVASGGMSITFFAMFGTFFLVAQYFQQVLGYSPLESGLLQLPMAIVMMFTAPRVPRLVERFGVRTVVPVGLGFVALGLFVFSQLGTDSSIWMVYPAILPLALGMSATMTPLTTLIMTSVPLGKAGVGSAMNDTTRELGGALGVAVLGSVVTTRYVAEIGGAVQALPAQAREFAESGLAGALRVAETIGGPAGAALEIAAKQAFVSGMSAAAIVGGIAVLVAAITARAILPNAYEVQVGPNGAPHPVDAEEDRVGSANLAVGAPSHG